MVNVNRMNKWIIEKAQGTKNSFLKIHFFVSTDSFQVMTVNKAQGGMQHPTKLVIIVIETKIVQIVFVYRFFNISSFTNG